MRIAVAESNTIQWNFTTQRRDKTYAQATYATHRENAQQHHPKLLFGIFDDAKEAQRP